MKRILILIAPVLVLFFAFRPVHVITVSGMVTDEAGNPISASIKVKGSSSATNASANGTYKIQVSKANDILVFTAVGYESLEERVKGRTTINVALKSPQIAMQEVVVSGMASKKQKVAYGPPMSRAVADYETSDMSAGYYNTDIPKPDFNREGYDNIKENIFLKATDNPLSTFSIDVDAASYSNVRRFINQGQLPPAGAVRIEEMINYFRYEYPQPTGDHPFSINTEITAAPWNKEHKLVLIGLQGKKIPVDNLPASNLVFLIDVSGSMSGPERIGLVKASMKMLVDQLRQKDKVSIVVYAGAAGLVLSPTSGDNKTRIKEAIDNLEAGGSTAGGAGIKLAYKTANDQFIKGGNNRVILCTDGDFNVGESSDDAMERLIETERKSGVFLTVLGYGMGNYQDAKMQKLADKGNGNHAYIDGITEAKKVLVNEFGGTLFTIAKDVKLQVEFNPHQVQAYRLIGYENRMLAKEDFNNDKKDAGELGSGHTVTALYEVIPVGVKSSFVNEVDPLKYQEQKTKYGKTAGVQEILTVKFRYKAPDGDISKLIEQSVQDQRVTLDRTSDNLRFAAAVAEFGMLIRESQFAQNASFENVILMARKAKGNDDEGYRSEFIRLAESAQMLAKTKTPERKEGSVKK